MRGGQLLLVVTASVNIQTVPGLVEFTALTAGETLARHVRLNVVPAADKLSQLFFFCLKPC